MVFGSDGRTMIRLICSEHTIWNKPEHLGDVVQDWPESLRLTIVYLGKSLPRHVRKNLEYLNKRFPLIQKTLVVDTNLRKSHRTQPGWSTIEYKRSETVTKAFSSLELNPKFRNGFWVYSFERLFALQSVHDQYPNDAVLQVEADVLLMGDFPFEKFLSLEKLAWLPNDFNEDVAALVFSPLPSTTKFLVDKLLQILSNDPTTSDMRALRTLRQEWSDRVETLPAAPGIENKWGGVFDPSSAGIWLLGNDPRNNRGVSRTRNVVVKGPAFDPSLIDIRTSGLALECRLPGKAWTPIWSLHLHSKDSSLFDLEEAIEQVSNSLEGGPRVNFKLIAFLFWFRELVRELLSRKAARALQRRFSTQLAESLSRFRR